MEIKLNLKLKNKRIAKLVEYHETKKNLCLVFQFLEGPPIIHLNDKNLPEDLDEVKKIMFHLLKGLEYLENMNVVHRDIKPYNLILKRKSEISSLKIIDFGLSCYQFEKNKKHKICGTGGFIAPEQFQTSPENFWKIVNSKLDVFSAGVVFHFYLFSKYIFEGEMFSGDGKSVYERNKRGNFEISSFEEMRVNPKSWKAYDLLSRMLAKKQVERCTIGEALHHDFFCVDEGDIPKDPMTQIGNYQERFGGNREGLKKSFLDKMIENEVIEEESENLESSNSFEREKQSCDRGNFD